MEGSIPVRSIAGLAARDIFYEQFNDVNFYVEDEDQENLYLELLKRTFPRLRITQIFPLGGKPNVIAHAQDPVNSQQEHRSVYILDKDFDDLLANLVIQKNIFYLDHYCIENYLLQEEAIVQIAIESHPTKKRETLRSQIKFDAFYNSSVKSLDPLFRLFFAVQRFNLGLKNCDLKPEQFTIKGKPWEIEPNAILDYENTVYHKVNLTGIFSNTDEFEKFLKNAFPRKGPRNANISGKFLLGLVFHHLRHNAAIGNVAIDSLRYRLARNCSVGRLRNFGGRIKAFLRTSGAYS